MKYMRLIEPEINLSSAPPSVEASAGCRTLGDLHANPLLLLYDAMQTGALINNPVVYQQLREIHDYFFSLRVGIVPSEQAWRLLQKMCFEQLEEIIDNLVQYQSLLFSLIPGAAETAAEHSSDELLENDRSVLESQLSEQGSTLYRLIGDVRADRGGCDCLILLLFDAFEKAGIPFVYVWGNHDLISFLRSPQSLLQGGPHVDYFYHSYVVSAAIESLGQAAVVIPDVAIGNSVLIDCEQFEGDDNRMKLRLFTHAAVTWFEMVSLIQGALQLLMPETCPEPMRQFLELVDKDIVSVCDVVSEPADMLLLIDWVNQAFHQFLTGSIWSLTSPLSGADEMVASCFEPFPYQVRRLLWSFLVPHSIIHKVDAFQVSVHSFVSSRYSGRRLVYHMLSDFPDCVTELVHGHEGSTRSMKKQFWPLIDSSYDITDDDINGTDGYVDTWGSYLRQILEICLPGSQEKKKSRCYWETLIREAMYRVQSCRQTYAYYKGTVEQLWDMLCSLKCDRWEEYYRQHQLGLCDESTFVLVSQKMPPAVWIQTAIETMPVAPDILAHPVEVSHTVTAFLKFRDHTLSGGLPRYINLDSPVGQGYPDGENVEYVESGEVPIVQTSQDPIDDAYFGQQMRLSFQSGMSQVLSMIGLSY